MTAREIMAQENDSDAEDQSRSSTSLLRRRVKKIRETIAQYHLVDHGKDYVNELGKIVRGKSDISPEPKDWRFKDEAWQKNFALKRCMQAYLAWCDTVEEIIPEGVRPEEKARMKLLSNALTSSVSPNNFLLTNPEAMRELRHSRGQSLYKGMKNLAHDMRRNTGLPSQVDLTKFKVGENLAATKGAVVYRDSLFELIQYKPLTAEVHSKPLLIIPPQISKYYFIDLAPGRSMVEHCVKNGIQCFMVVWRNPGADSGDWGMNDYIQALLDATDVVCEITDEEKINYLGFCAGGLTLSILLAYLKVIGRDCVNSASMGVTLLDFDAAPSIGSFKQPALLDFVKHLGKERGYLPQSALSSTFSWMRPNELIWNYWCNNYLMGKQPPAFDILAWNADGTNVAAKLHGDFLDILEDSSLLRGGRLKILGKRIDISKVDSDLFVLAAVTDHLTPWKGCYRTTQIMRGKKTFVLSNSGHIAALVNPPGNPKASYFTCRDLPPDPDQWLAGAEKNQGSWWEAWIDWLQEKSPDVKKAPRRLGRKQYKPLCPAPGKYVFEEPRPI